MILTHNNNWIATSKWPYRPGTPMPVIILTFPLSIPLAPNRVRSKKNLNLKQIDSLPAAVDRQLDQD